jgi:hypothetical protein
VQWADVSIVGHVRADLILVIGATQLVALLWSIRLRRVGFHWARRLLALAGL